MPTPDAEARAQDAHTRGPWELTPYDQLDFAHQEIFEEGTAIISGVGWTGLASVNTHVEALEGPGEPFLKMSREGMANARLIAAAPDLLAALNDILSPDAFHVAVNRVELPEAALRRMIAEIYDKAHAAIAKATGQA